MLGLGKRTVVSDEPVAIVRPAPLLVPVGREVKTLPIEDNERRAYERTCEAIGFEPASLLHARILSFFKANGIRVFNYEDVSAYMVEKAEAEDKIWHWRPLRSVDVVTDWDWGANRLGNFGQHISIDGWKAHDYYSARVKACRTYHREVPLRVLGTVEQIHKEFGDKVNFFVTDYSSPNPDPFIGIIVRDMERIVFDYWDEPDFAVKLEK